MDRNITFSRGLLYSDNSGVETGVSFNPTYRLGGSDQSYVRIYGVGDHIDVRVDHIEFIIDCLREVEREYDNFRVRAAIAKPEGKAK